MYNKIDSFIFSQVSFVAKKLSDTKIFDTFYKFASIQGTDLPVTDLNKGYDDNRLVILKNIQVFTDENKYLIFKELCEKAGALDVLEKLELIRPVIE